MIRFIAFVAFTAALTAQPKFEDYPAGKQGTGKPAPAKVERPSDRMYRTKIRDAAAKGPNFAGHFTVAQWGCGAGCVETVIVDATNGTVYHLPAAELPCSQPTCPLEVSCTKGEPFEYKLTSQLFVVRGCGKEGAPFTKYLRWTGTRFEAIP